MRFIACVGFSVALIACGGVLAPGPDAVNDDASGREAGAPDARAPSDAGADDASADASADAGIPKGCGYRPDFSSVGEECGYGCLVALRRSGAAEVLATVNDGGIGSSAVVLAGDDVQLWVSSSASASSGADAGGDLLVLPSQGGAASAIASWGQTDMVSNLTTHAGMLYFARVETVADEDVLSFYRWPLHTSAQATSFGSMVTTPPAPSSPWNGPSIIIDDGFLYAIRATGGVDSIDLQNVSVVHHVADGPLLDALVDDGSVFVVRSGGVVERVPGAGGAAVTIATLPPFTSMAFDVDRTTHTLIALGSQCQGDCAEYPGSELFRVAEDGSSVTPLTSLYWRAAGLSVEGTRAYFYDECEKVPEGTISATRFYDMATGELRWVGDEPGFPFVPHALGVRSSRSDPMRGLVVTSTSIYGHYAP